MGKEKLKYANAESDWRVGLWISSSENGVRSFCLVLTVNVFLLLSSGSSLPLSTSETDQYPPQFPQKRTKLSTLDTTFSYLALFFLALLDYSLSLHYFSPFLRLPSCSMLHPCGPRLCTCWCRIRSNSVGRYYKSTLQQQEKETKFSRCTINTGGTPPRNSRLFFAFATGASR